jgi:REP element-mobilizing transposase RayT
MARPLRIEFAGAFYHVTARGNERQPIFRCDTDRHRFLAMLADTVGQYRLLLHAYVLMDNHYHLLVETLEANLSRAMRELNGTYAQSFNRSHHRVGHLLQGRYKAPLVQRDSYLVELSRYVHLNPVRAGIVMAARDYAWSSARAYVGECAVPAFLTVAEVLGHFGATPRRARRRYAEFLHDARPRPLPSPLDQVVGQTLLGEPNWVEAMQERIRKCIETGRLRVVESEQPAVRRLRPRPTAAQVLGVVAAATATDAEVLGRPRARSAARAIAMYLVHKVVGLTLAQVGLVFGISRFGASKAIRRAERSLERNAHKLRLVNALRPALEAQGSTVPRQHDPRGATVMKARVQT